MGGRGQGLGAEQRDKKTSHGTYPLFTWSVHSVLYGRICLTRNVQACRIGESVQFSPERVLAHRAQQAMSESQRRSMQHGRVHLWYRLPRAMSNFGNARIVSDHQAQRARLCIYIISCRVREARETFVAAHSGDAGSELSLE